VSAGLTWLSLDMIFSSSIWIFCETRGHFNFNRKFQTLN
jgi:hypothetical protein